MVLVGGGQREERGVLEFVLDYANLLEVLGKLSEAWSDYLRVMAGQVRGPVVVNIDVA